LEVQVPAEERKTLVTVRFLLHAFILTILGGNLNQATCKYLVRQSGLSQI